MREVYFRGSCQCIRAFLSCLVCHTLPTFVVCTVLLEQINDDDDDDEGKMRHKTN